MLWFIEQIADKVKRMPQGKEWFWLAFIRSYKKIMCSNLKKTTRSP
jgi:hypothetical protein